MGTKISFPSLNLTDIVAILLCGLSILELNNSWFRYVCLGLLLLWLLCVIGSGDGKKLLPNRCFLLLLVYVVFVLAYLALCDGIVDATKNALVIMLRECPVLLFIYYYERMAEEGKKVKLINGFMLAVTFAVSLNLLKILSNDINAARVMAAYNNPYSNKITGGGYQLAYALSLALPYIIYKFKKTDHKIIHIVLIVVYAVTLLKCSYTLAILLSLAELFLLYYFNPERDKPVSFKFAGILIIIALVFILRVPIANFLRDTVAPLFGGSFVARRIKQIGDYLLGYKAADNGAVMRFKLYGISIKTFLEHPIFGISYKTVYNSALERPAYYIGYVGQHSSILDGFARFGIFYLIYVAYLVCTFRYLKERTSNAFTIVFFCFMVIKLINLGDAFGMCYFTYFFIPFTEILTRNKEKTRLFYTARQKQRIKNELESMEKINGTC